MKLNLENEKTMEQKVNAILDAKIMKLVSDHIEKKVNEKLDEIEKDEQKYINDYIEKNADKIILDMIDKVTKEREVLSIESSSESHTEVLEVVEDKLQEDVKEVEIKPIIEEEITELKIKPTIKEEIAEQKILLGSYDTELEEEEEIFTLKLEEKEKVNQNEKLDIDITNLLLDGMKEKEESPNEDVEDALMNFMLRDDKLQGNEVKKPVQAKIQTHDSFELHIPDYDYSEVIRKTIDDKRSDLKMQVINLLNSNRDNFTFELRLKTRNEFIESLINNDERTERLYKLSKEEFNKEILANIEK